MKLHLPLSITLLLSLLLISCSDSNAPQQKDIEDVVENSSSKSIPTLPSTIESLAGQWKTEGNEGTGALWLEFDTTASIFHEWGDDAPKPSQRTGNFKLLGDSIIQFTYNEDNKIYQYRINALQNDSLDIISLGVSAGNFVYTKTAFTGKEEIEKDSLEVIGILKSVEESDFWGRVYLHVEVDGKLQVFPYYEVDISFKETRKLIGKEVAITFKNEVTIEENDLHINNSTIHGEYGQVKSGNTNNGGDFIEGTLIIHEHDRAGDLPSSYRIVDNNGDTTTITAFVNDNHIAQNGKKGIVYYSTRTKRIAQTIRSQEKEDVLVGKWVKEDASNPIDPRAFEIKREDENGYDIIFGENKYYAALNSNIIKGEGQYGDYTLEVISEDPLIISYSDDGKGGHFNPSKDVRFVKIKSNKDLLIGKWQSTDDPNNSLEFTKFHKIETYVDYMDKENYALSTTCEYQKVTESDDNSYISGARSKQCWYIISVDDEKLSLSYVGRGNTLNYTRVIE